MKQILFYTFALLLTFLLPARSAAQTGACPTGSAVSVNPSGDVCITPNTDHDATTTAPGTGAIVPVVVRYDLLLFAPSVTDTATGTPTQTINIGKPARNAQNGVWATVPAVTQIPVGQQYKARVVAVGQPLTVGGPAQVSARSPESNPFMRLAPPTAPLAPLAISVPN